MKAHELRGADALHVTIEITLVDGAASGALTAKWPGRTCRATYLPEGARSASTLALFPDGGIVLTLAEQPRELSRARRVFDLEALLRGDSGALMVVTNDHDLLPPKVYARAARILVGERPAPGEDHYDAIADEFAADARALVMALAIPGFVVA